MDLRDFLRLLEDRSELLHISREVDPKYELGALLEQAEARGRAILFEKVKGGDFPAVGSVLLNRQRQALAMNRDEHFLDDRDGYRILLDEAWANPVPQTDVGSGPVHDVVLTGDDIDLTRLPVPRFFDGDSHPFITAGLGLAADPDTGHQNLGFYRTPVLDRNTITINASRVSHLRRIYVKTMETNDTMPIALVVGGPPCLYMTAGSQVRPGIADIAVAGAMQQESIEMVKCSTNDLMVPAQAEFVIEAEVDLRQGVDHVMGEWGDDYGVNTSPIAHVTAITHREDPIFQVINGGMNREHYNLGVWLISHLRADLQKLLQEQFPFVTDVHLHSYPPHGGARARAAVAIDKSDDSQPQQVIDAVYGHTAGRFPLALLLQRVVVTDDDVDITDEHDIEWAIGSRLADPANIEVLEAGGFAHGGKSMRICIDATVPMSMKEHAARPRIPDFEQYDLDKYL